MLMFFLIVKKFIIVKKLRKCYIIYFGLWYYCIFVFKVLNKCKIDIYVYIVRLFENVLDYDFIVIFLIFS